MSGHPATTLRARLAVLGRIRVVNRLGRLTRETVKICMRYRVTGLASEAGFFALLSLPPLILGLFGGVGYFGKAIGRDNVHEITDKIIDVASKVLTADTVRNTITPTLNSAFTDGRADLISIGFLLSIWSGSRVLNVFVDTISIMYGQSGIRGIVRTRILSLSLYAGSLVVGIVVFPLVVLGPTLIRELLHGHWTFLVGIYWPLLTVLTVASLSTLYWIATPKRSHWLRNVPGAVLTLVIWVLASVILRWFLGESVGPRSTSIYGPLSAPIVVLIWLYFLAIAVLIGAALNAATHTLWPTLDRAARRPRGLRRSRPLTPMPAAVADELDEEYAAARFEDAPDGTPEPARTAEPQSSPGPDDAPLPIDIEAPAPVESSGSRAGHP